MLPILHVHNTVAAGVIFGMVLWIIALFIMKPVTGTGFRGYELGRLALVVSLLGHFTYGILLGLLAGLM